MLVNYTILRSSNAPSPSGAGSASPTILKEDIMKTLNVSQPLSAGAAASRFETARMLAISMAEADSELLEPELVAWIDRPSAMASPVLEGCGGPDGWRHYGVSHGGRLEVDVGDDAVFIFAESSPFDSYDHFGPGPYRNMRDAQGNEAICRPGGVDCIPLDEWSSKLT
jgi:hypothetical protein